MNEKDFVYEGLGFPIVLHGVEIKKFSIGEGPHIDVKKVAAHAIRELITPEARLTGSHLPFIRDYLEMNRKEFAILLKHPDTEIQKWEDLSDQPVNIDVETALKQQIKNQVTSKDARLLTSQGLFSSSSIKPAGPENNSTAPQPKKKR
jgi:DNA-binding transcriptional regulator YiaG